MFSIFKVNLCLLVHLPSIQPRYNKYCFQKGTGWNQSPEVLAHVCLAVLWRWKRDSSEMVSCSVRSWTFLEWSDVYTRIHHWSKPSAFSTFLVVEVKDSNPVLNPIVKQFHHQKISKTLCNFPITYSIYLPRGEFFKKFPHLKATCIYISTNWATITSLIPLSWTTLGDMYKSQSSSLRNILNFFYYIPHNSKNFRQHLVLNVLPSKDHTTIQNNWKISVSCSRK